MKMDKIHESELEISNTVEVGKARRIAIETRSIVDAVQDSTDTVHERFNRAVKNTNGYSTADSSKHKRRVAA